MGPQTCIDQHNNMYSNRIEINITRSPNTMSGCKLTKQVINRIVEWVGYLNGI